MKFSIVVSTQPAQFQAATFKGDLESNLRTVADLGYQGAELAIRDPNLVDYDLVEKLTRKYSLSVPAIGTGQAWGEEGLSFTDPDLAVREAAIQRVKDHIDGASRFGAIIIIGLLRGTLKKGIDPVLAEKWMADAIQECCQAASSKGAKLALEPINRYETTFINSVSQGLRLVDKIGMSNFGLLLDTFHMNIEEASIEESIRLCGDHILHFHVADSNRWHPGAGHIDFKSILAALHATGYEGWVSGEFLPIPDAITGARNNIEYLSIV